jgi:hypothetical protein
VDDQAGWPCDRQRGRVLVFAFRRVLPRLTVDEGFKRRERHERVESMAQSNRRDAAQECGEERQDSEGDDQHGGASDLTSWHCPHRSGGAKRISGYAEVQ